MNARKRMLFALGGVGTVLLLSAGCAASVGRDTYTQHLSHRVSPGVAGNVDVAFTFGLDGMGDQGNARAEDTEATWRR